LAALHRRVRDYAKAVLWDGTIDAATAASLLREIVALRPEITNVATESPSGSVRSAAAQSTAVALVAEVYAARTMSTIPATADPAFRDMMTTTLDRSSERLPTFATVGRGDTDAGARGPMSAPLSWASKEFLRRDAEVRGSLAALNASSRPTRAWRMPLYRSQRIAAAAGIRAAACLALASAFYVLAGWPAADVSLSVVALILGLGAINADPNRYTALAFIAAPIAAVLAGTLEFLILDGVNEFALLALALAPYMIGAGVLMTRPNPLLSSLGRINLFFILLIFKPSNPPSYDPEAFLFTSLFVCIATALLVAVQILIPTPSSERVQGWIIASARRNFEHVRSGRGRHLAPEEAMFRDAARIAQIPVDGTGARDSAVLAEALSYFDRAAAIRLSRVSLARLAETSLSHLAAEAETALAAQDTQRLRDVARTLKNVAEPDRALVEEIDSELALAAIVIDAAVHTAPPIMETVS
jgi:fusaric acid resistance family protein